MAATLTTADAVLKDDYKGPVREQINQYFFILTQIDKNTEDIVGRRGVLPLHISRSSGVGARKEGGTLPTAGNQGYAPAYVPIRRNYARIEVTGPSIKAMSKDRGSFIRQVDSETEGITKDLQRDVNRQIWGTADGVIATCGTTTTSLTVQLLATTTQAAMRQLWDDGGMVVDIGTVAAPTTIASARPVTAYDPVNKTITITGATISTVSGTHFVFRTGAGGGPGTTGLESDSQSELTGLQFIVSTTGSLHTVNPATFPMWKAQTYTNGGTARAISENLVNQAIMETEVASGAQVDMLVASLGVSRAVNGLLQSLRRNIDNVDLKAGYSGIKWSTPMEGNRPGSKPKALVWDRDCPDGSLFGLSSSQLVQFEESDWDWMDEDGAVLCRVANKDSYEATLFKYHELACSQRNAHFRISDITES